MNKIKTYLTDQVSIAPLVTFRVLFGSIMFVSIIRFILNDWVKEQYIEPQFYFTYFGFEWVKPLGESGMYIAFFLMALAALAIALGLFYRYSSIVFFVLFTYVELIDKTNYLNHYYFVSVVSFMLIFLPANRQFSIDCWFDAKLSVSFVPRWTIFFIQLQLAIVYFYAGAAKLNYDWMVEALPLRMWLPPNSHVPVAGFLFEKLWVAYFFSWFGAIYDLTIPFFLFSKRTRSYAYIAVIMFHVLTWLLFPIGMFPFIMILSTLIFFSGSFHESLLERIRSILNIKLTSVQNGIQKLAISSWPNLVLIAVLVIQVLLPWRYLAYPGNIFWTEEGYRFSWRVMLMEKAGYVIFHITDPENGRTWEAYARDYLTPNQEKMMSTQPDMILQYAHFLKKMHRNEGVENPEIRAEAYVTLNGKGSRLFIDSTVDLTKEQDGFSTKKWILSDL